MGKAIRFAGVENAEPSAEALRALEDAAAIVFCPSNPFVSIEPILALRGIRARIENSRAVRIAVSPIVGGEALKGPAAKMFRELGITASALAVAQRYAGLLTGFVLDRIDADQAGQIKALGMDVLVTDTVMRTEADRERLAGELVNWIIGAMGH